MEKVSLISFLEENANKWGIINESKNVYSLLLEKGDTIFESLDKDFLNRLVAMQSNICIECEIKPGDKLYNYDVTKIILYLSLENKVALRHHLHMMFNRKFAFDKMYYCIHSVYVNSDFFNRFNIDESQINFSLILDTCNSKVLNLKKMNAHDVIPLTDSFDTVNANIYQLSALSKSKISYENLILNFVCKGHYGKDWDYRDDFRSILDSHSQNLNKIVLNSFVQKDVDFFLNRLNNVSNFICEQREEGLFAEIKLNRPK